MTAILTAMSATTDVGIANMQSATKYGKRMMREFIAEVLNPENQYTSWIEINIYKSGRTFPDAQLITNCQLL